jgi:malic enzyme
VGDELEDERGDRDVERRVGERHPIGQAGDELDPASSLAAEPARVFEYTNKGNCIAIVSDGSRVLGLGDVGPEAGLPVMEGKALLFKYLGGVDAVPLCVRTRDADELIRVVECLEPSFGAINLEDIAQPKCFRVLDQLRARLAIPVWHDDQQGTATVLLAALLNALQVVGKELRAARIAMIGMGAANVAVYRLLRAAGIDPALVVACDRDGILHRQRGDIEALQAALNSLPWKMREVFILAVIEDRSYQDISNIVGRSLLSVKTDIYRARMATKERLSRYLTSGRNISGKRGGS